MVLICFVNGAVRVVFIELVDFEYKGVMFAIPKAYGYCDKDLGTIAHAVLRFSCVEAE